MDKQVSSEEKLLKLIRKKKPFSRQGKPDNLEGSLGDSVDKSSLKQLGKKNKKGSDLILLSTRILILISLLMVGYIVYKYLWLGSDQGFGRDNEPIVVTRGVKIDDVVIPQEEPKPFTYYQDVISERNVFQAPWDIVKKEVEIVPVVENDLNQKLKVVGIILDEQPTAIMEDLVSKQSVFMGIGDEIYNARLEDILEDKVVFILNGQRVELYP